MFKIVGSVMCVNKAWGCVTGAPYDVTVKRQDARHDASGANPEPLAGGGDTSSCQHSPNLQ